MKTTRPPAMRRVHRDQVDHRIGAGRQERPPDTTRGFGCGAHARRTTAIPGPKSPATQRPGHDALMPPRVHLLSPDHGALPCRRHHTPPVTATRATASDFTARIDAPSRRYRRPRTSICGSSPALSVDRPVVVMVTRPPRDHDPGRPRPLYAGHHVARPPPGDEHPQFGDDPERSRRPPHRRASRRARSGNQCQKRNESCGKTIQGMKTDPPTVPSRLR